MSRPPDSGRLDLGELFHRAQQEMLAPQLHVGGLIEHGPTAGAATERHWIALFERYLPKRYKASSAFVIDSRGNRSRQIDIAIYDHFYSPLLFPQGAPCTFPLKASARSLRGQAQHVASPGAGRGGKGRVGPGAPPDLSHTHQRGKATFRRSSAEGSWRLAGRELGMGQMSQRSRPILLRMRWRGTRETRETRLGL